ncbi:unnamed protein product (macronuclear) [Paramecium tetraurelia]|uniref:Uncharacterized protein n=1 Tax=Paramecium tetraurelia TaxID=5888 RepID=A0BG32_PARTE|nr:uncharacterized protein GSPATT00028534001 [Paramecium tetraurelia]CAK57499.1 unnamed protein product [Paramecium tetraurelia]|eukprot:XP_001424897.1 hypothetical protein (macronuclear) [Paramecium tetraurelia strain d4-2]
MGNWESKEPVKIEDQQIVKATYVTRDLQSGGISKYLPVKHAGILVETKEEKYIIHHLGPDKDVETELYNDVRSQKWKADKRIKVNNNTTIKEAEKIGGKGKGYWRNCTCIGVAFKIWSGLQSG